MRRAAFVFVAAAVAAVALAAAGAHAIGDPYPAGDCRTGTIQCPNGCCTKACPNGSAGAATPNGVPGLSATIKDLTYSPSTALVTGTLIVTNAGKSAIANVTTAVSFAPFSASDSSYVSIGNMWCGGQKEKTLAAGASRACPFALVGGADPAKYDWQQATSRAPQPGVDPTALKQALAFSTSDVPQVPDLPRGLKPSAVSAYAEVSNTSLYPQQGDKTAFFCAYAYVPAKAA
jgi:hypothetical protein